jgi:hypothetical protein
MVSRWVTIHLPRTMTTIVATIARRMSIPYSPFDPIDSSDDTNEDAFVRPPWQSDEPESRPMEVTTSMSAYPLTFNRGAVRPVECLRAGWQTIKSDYWMFLGITFLGMMIGSIVPIVIFGPMMCGIHMCLLRKMRGEQVAFDQLFKGFDYFVPSLIATLVQMLPMFLIFVPTYVGGILLFVLMAEPGRGGSPNLAPFLVIYLAIVAAAVVVGTLISSLFMFSYQLIVERKMSGLEACKASFRAVMANFGGVIGLMLLNMLGGMVGVMACYVGAILFVPISFAAMDVAYRQVFPEAPVEARPLFGAPPQYRPSA